MREAIRILNILLELGIFLGSTILIFTGNTMGAIYLVVLAIWLRLSRVEASHDQ